MAAEISTQKASGVCGGKLRSMISSTARSPPASHARARALDESAGRSEEHKARRQPFQGFRPSMLTIKPGEPDAYSRVGAHLPSQGVERWKSQRVGSREEQ